MLQTECSNYLEIQDPQTNEFIVRLLKRMMH